MKGRIVSVDFNVTRAVYLQQGVRKDKQYKFDGYFPGGNGTYVVGGEYSSSIDLKVFVYDLDRCVTIDIKDLVLEINKRRRVSEQMVNTIRLNNIGKKITVYSSDYGYGISCYELNLAV